MSSTSARWLVAALVTLGLGLEQDARAGGQVDWSEYIDKNPSKTPTRAGTSRPLETAAVEKKSTRSKGAKKRSAASRTKKKAPARGKRRR